MITHESHLEAFSPMQMDDFNINIINIMRAISLYPV